MTYNASVLAAGDMPLRIKRLPISERGFPTPWFVQWFKDGKPSKDGEGAPDFRVVDPRKLVRAVKEKKCWVCGQGPLGVHKAFVIGPMCSINRVISEPPLHRECAFFTARVCPFLAKPNMLRNSRGLVEDGKLLDGYMPAPGTHLERNPGAVCIWITRSFKPFRPGRGHPGTLFALGPPEETIWFSGGRPASRAEVMASIEGGYPSLEAEARAEGPEALVSLATMRARAMSLLPVQ